jgi:hypothetical protein
MGCAGQTNAFPALSTTGELQADGGGECGAVAISADRALTSAHCVRDGGAVYYHAPGEAEGRKVRRTWIDEVTGGACLDVSTNTPPSELGSATAGDAIVLEGNVTGVSHGTVSRRRVADVYAQQGDSGSALRSIATGAVIGLVRAGMTPGDSAHQIAFTEATAASELCR